MESQLIAAAVIIVMIAAWAAALYVEATRREKASS